MTIDNDVTTTSTCEENMGKTPKAVADSDSVETRNEEIITG